MSKTTFTVVLTLAFVGGMVVGYEIGSVRRKFLRAKKKALEEEINNVKSKLDQV